MNTLYKIKVEMLTKIHKNKEVHEHQKKVKNTIKETKELVNKQASRGQREVVTFLGTEEMAKEVIKYFTKHNFKAIYKFHPNNYTQHAVTITW